MTSFSLLSFFLLFLFLSIFLLIFLPLSFFLSFFPFTTACIFFSIASLVSSFRVSVYSHILFLFLCSVFYLLIFFDFLDFRLALPFHSVFVFDSHSLSKYSIMHLCLILFFILLFRIASALDSVFRINKNYSQAIRQTKSGERESSIDSIMLYFRFFSF